MKRTRIKRRSARKKLRDELGNLHLQILKKERDNYDTCEICGNKTRLCRFHIISVGECLRLEFHEYNILLTCWHPCHFNWHHDYYKGKEIEKEIMRLRGENYRDKLLILDRTQPRHTDLYLNTLRHALKRRCAFDS